MGMSEMTGVSTKSHILHNIPFRESRQAAHSVDRLLGLRLLFQERQVLEVVQTPILSAWLRRDLASSHSDTA